MAEFPDVRIGTAERERALDDLARHFSAGRLSVAEFDERSGLVAAATTRVHLAAVFTDLPPLVPEGVPPPPKKRNRGSWDWRAATIALTPFLSIALFLTLHNWMFFLLIPAVPAIIEGGRRALPADKHRSHEIE